MDYKRYLELKTAEKITLKKAEDGMESDIGVDTMIDVASEEVVARTDYVTLNSL